MVRCFLGVRGDVLRAEDFLSFVNFLLVKSCFLGVSIVMVGVVFLTGFGATASGLGVVLLFLGVVLHLLGECWEGDDWCCVSSVYNRCGALFLGHHK